MHDGLTKREREVLGWLYQGLSNKEIAMAMAISPRTVQKHLQRIYQWLGAQTRCEVIARRACQDETQGITVRALAH